MSETVTWKRKRNAIDNGVTAQIKGNAARVLKFDILESLLVIGRTRWRRRRMIHDFRNNQRRRIYYKSCRRRTAPFHTIAGSRKNSRCLRKSYWSAIRQGLRRERAARQPR